MLEVQRYLRSGKTLGDLMAEFNIDCFAHDRLPLIGLNYGVDSPKFETITRECRGLILRDETWDVIAKPFNRFFNYGEGQEAENFDWNRFEVFEKLDGTFISLSYFHEAGEWIVATRGTFGNHVVGSTAKTWRDLFCEVSGLDLDNGKSGLTRDVTYCFELWTPWNRIIRDYTSPRAWLLGAFDDDLEELSSEWCSLELLLMESAVKHRILMAPRYPELKSKDDIDRFLKDREADDPTYEGVVLRDVHGRRLKVKTQTYLALHAFFGNGNLYLPKRLVPLWHSQDYDEVLLRFPDVKLYLFQVGETLDRERYKLWNLWQAVKDIESQKEFAITILPRTEFSGILFDVRKRFFGREVTWKDFCDAWKQWPELQLKKLFKEEAPITT